MSNRTVRRNLVALVLTALVFSGCLDDAAKEGLEEPADPTPENPGPVEVISPGWPALNEAIIRPGVKIAGDVRVETETVGELSGTCTTNFVFSSPDNRTLYVGAASHCFIGTALGANISLADGAVMGTLVYCAWAQHEGSDICPSLNALDEGWANDFALVKLPDEARHLVHPAMIHWGGPTHLLTSPPGPDQHVLTYGNTSLRDGDQDGPGSDAADATEGVTAAPISNTSFTPAHPANWSTLARFVSPRIPGDSGSGVILAGGAALGIASQILPNEAALRITNLAPAMEFLQNNTDLRIELKTWETLAQPSLPFSVPDEGAARRSAAEG